jgi:pyruvate dehydrogenase kinase 2/3/4
MKHFPIFYNKIFDYSLKKGNHVKFIDILKNIHISKDNRINYLTKYIYKETPIILANRVTDLNNLPFGLSKNHSINTIRTWYLTSFLELTEINEPQTENEIIKFRSIINNIYNRHSNTLVTVSKGIYELKKENKISDIEAPMIQTFLNRFYKNRTEIRILLEQYLSLFENNNDKKYFGIINLETDLLKIMSTVINDLQFVIDQNKLNIILDDIIKVHNNVNIKIPCMENYLYYVIFELLKNSTQAVLDKAKIENNYKPMINVNINKIDDEYILIVIKDNGIGIKEKNMEKIWYYSFSTSLFDSNNIVEESDFNTISPLSGLGYGLPISEIYMNFLNSSKNNIKINSVYNKGTTVYLYVKCYNEYL